MPKIAVDAMGGDHAPQVVVEGALLASQELGIEIVLVGQKEVIEQELARHKRHPLQIVPASETVVMHESPSSALRKKDSSMKVAFDMMRRGGGHRVVRGGNSGGISGAGN